MLEPWIIEEILRREERKRREGEGQPLHVPADDPRETPERPGEKTPGPGHEMPSPGSPQHDERPTGDEKEDRGVTRINIAGDDDEDNSNTIDTHHLPDAKDGDEPGERSE